MDARARAPTNLARSNDGRKRPERPTQTRRPRTARDEPASTITAANTAASPITPASIMLPSSSRATAYGSDRDLPM